MDRKKVLLVDDDPMTLRMGEYLLREALYDVYVASSGEDCLEKFKSVAIDLVILDIEMPGMNGFAVLEKIRELKSEQKVIIITGVEFSKYAEEARRFNIESFVSKPLYPAEFQERVSQALKTGGKENVLVIDDEAMERLKAKRMLQDTYNVEVADGPQSAFNILQNFKPALIFLDIYMPQMDGFELLQKLRELDNCKDVPVVFLTAADDSETEIKVFKAGADDFIKKPCVQDVILERSKRILSLRSLQYSLKSEVDRRTGELLESQRKLKMFSLQMVKTLAGTIDAKDAYTRGHSVRVAKYSREIAARMGKSIEELEDIYFIALLHDIGKIGVPDSVLNKTSRLTDEEFEQIKKHPYIGADILKNIPEMPNIAIGAHWHHERYDGRGYPDGLKGEEIPEIARIIGVADSYDAMTSRRSYRAALPQEVVRGEIEKGMGSQFDPAIGAIMLQMIDADTEYKMRDDYFDASL